MAPYSAGRALRSPGMEVGSTLTLHDGTNAGNFSLSVTANNTMPGEVASSAARKHHGDGERRPGGRGWQPNQFGAGQSAGSEWRTGRGHDHRCAVRLEPQRGDKPRQRHLDGADGRPQRADGPDSRRLRRRDGAQRDRDLDQCRRQHREPHTVADNVEAYAPGTPIFALVGRRHADRRRRQRSVRVRAADRQRHDLQFQCCDRQNRSDRLRQHCKLQRHSRQYCR